MTTASGAHERAFQPIGGRVLYCVSNSLFRNDPAIVEIFEYLRVLGVNWDESFRLRSLDEVFNLIIA
jgi:hypothetical protein